MVNKRLFLGILIVGMGMVFGILFIMCGNNEPIDENNNNENSQTSTNNDSTFTLIDIPSKYNGKFAKLEGAVLSGLIKNIYGFNYNLPSKEIRYIPINNSSVIIPLWVISGIYYLPFYDTRGFYIMVSIFEHDLDNGKDNLLAEIAFASVVFHNGNTATRSWNDKTYFRSEH
jgi:hypothetical protein